MKKRIETINQLNAPIEKLWANVRTGEKWENWLPILSGSKVEGDKRVCHTYEGGDLHETIVKVDDAEKLFQYRIDRQEMMPISNVIATMKFHESQGNTELNWSVEFDVADEETFATVEKNISEIYNVSAQKLAELSQ